MLPSKPSFPVPHVSHETDVLVVGGGPVGMVAAYQLALMGQPCMLVEQNTLTTRWPKMEFTRSRSMELFRKMGLVDELREQGVPENFRFDEIFSTGYGEGGDRISLWVRMFMPKFEEYL